jgi:3-hydroxymyristoyl/3-hydroxydecanoyl-(acyl carrier protein) dehydratase
MGLISTESLEAEAVIDPASAWLDGHFPDYPILPAVALIDLGFRIVRRAEPERWLSGLRRAKFKKSVGPGQRLSIRLDRGQPSSGVWSLKMNRGGHNVLAAQLVCSSDVSSCESGGW